MTWIKICGTTNLEDALTAVEAGANALGFVFYEKSPRNIQVETAREIVKHLPAGVEKVGVFVNEGEDSISRIADEVGLTATQFHGDHEDARVADLVAGRRPPLKVFVAISMSRRDPRERAIMWNPKVVHAFLLDSGISSRHGGTGESFDWSASIPTVRPSGVWETSWWRAV
jgi:phosphoribosylanthranilate isomerase